MTNYEKKIEKHHLSHFKAQLIANGASSKTADKQVRASCGYKASLNSFTAGWELAVELYVPAQEQ